MLVYVVAVLDPLRRDPSPDTPRGCAGRTVRLTDRASDPEANGGGLGPLCRRARRIPAPGWRGATSCHGARRGGRAPRALTLEATLRDGTRAVSLEPLDFIVRLGALIRLRATTARQRSWNDMRQQIQRFGSRSRCRYFEEKLRMQKWTEKSRKNNISENQRCFSIC